MCGESESHSEEVHDHPCNADGRYITFYFNQSNYIESKANVINLKESSLCEVFVAG